MKLFRFEFEDEKIEYPHTGIICGMNEVFDDTLTFHLVRPFEDDLPFPNVDLSGYDKNIPIYAFFTDIGILKFASDIWNITRQGSIRNIKSCMYFIEIPSTHQDVLYADQYQFLVKNPYDKPFQKYEMPNDYKPFRWLRLVLDLLCHPNASSAFKSVIDNKKSYDKLCDNKGE